MIWQQYFDSIPESPENVADLKPFAIPNTVLPNPINTISRKTALSVDDGIHNVDTVAFRNFNPSQCRRALKIAEAEVISAERMDQLT